MLVFDPKEQRQVDSNKIFEIEEVKATNLTVPDQL
jgi:hypothetical protein